MARFQMGCEVTELYAAGGVLVDPEIGKAGDLDTAVITLRFQNGAIGTIDNSRKSVFGYDQRLEVFGSGGMAEAANAFPNTVTLSNGKSVARDLPLNFFLDRYAESYVREMEAFVACVRDGKEPPVSGRDGQGGQTFGRAEPIGEAFRYQDVKRGAAGFKAIREMILKPIDTGVDILDPIQVSACGMDMRELERVYDSDLVYWGGGVDTPAHFAERNPTTGA
jgi:predicted dehydrogenase